MTIPLVDRVREETTSYGTNPIVQLNGAYLRCSTFASSFAIGTTGIPYVYEARGNSADYEEGYGTLLSATTFQRVTVTKSSNAGGFVNFGPGVKDLYNVLPSAVIQALQAFAPSYYSLPAITGTAQELQRLSVSTGSWDNAPVGFTYQWYRGNLVVTGATLSTYVLSSADVGYAMTCIVTATNAAGSVPAQSLPSAIVVSISVPIPVNTGAPVISGSGVVGQTLTATQGTWTNSPTSFAYQWKRGGTAITGATASTYLLVTADAATTITCTVTATNGAGSVSATSNAISVSGTDTTAPTIASQVVANATPTFVSLMFSEAMDQTSIPAFSSFTVSGHTVTAFAFDDATHAHLTVSAAFVNGEAARTLNYTQPGTGNLKDLAGNLLANVTAAAITNNVAAGPSTTRARFAQSTATAGVDSAAALFASMTQLSGTLVNDRSGGIATTSSPTQYGWVAVLASAAGSGVTFTDGSATTGGWNGALSSSIYSGGDANPTTIHATYTDGSSNVWNLYRTSGHANGVTFTLS